MLLTKTTVRAFLLVGLIAISAALLLVGCAEDKKMQKEAKAKIKCDTAEGAEGSDFVKALEDALKEKMAFKTNNDRFKFKSCNVITQMNGGYGAVIEFNADDNLSDDMRKGGIEIEMTDLYKLLYTDSKLKAELKSIVLQAYFPLVDKFGNEKDGMVYKTFLDVDVAQKIQWDNVNSDMMQKLWTTSLIHPAMQK